MFRVVEKRKQILIATFSSMPQRVALTFNCWKTLNGFHCIVISAHFIDSDWLLNKRIIGFKKKFPHNGSNLSQTIMKVVREF